MTRPVLHALGTGLLLALAGCGTSSGPAGESGSADASIPAGGWVLVAGEDEDGPITPRGTHPVTLDVGEEAVSGTAACNTYSAPVGGDDGALLGSATATEMGCLPRSVMALERRYLDALAGVDSAAARAPGLVLTGATVRLEFRPQE